ncbi:MAG: hypothetical protein LBJ24_02885, partial [Treponema sp.]|nr:hypothetical protein [Treponema sp.]
MYYKELGTTGKPAFMIIQFSVAQSVAKAYMPFTLEGVEIMRRFNFYRRNGIYYARLITPQGI